MDIWDKVKYWCESQPGWSDYSDDFILFKKACQNLLLIGNSTVTSRLADIKRNHKDEVEQEIIKLRLSDG